MDNCVKINVASVGSSSSPSVREILKEAWRIPLKNGRVTFSIMLLVLCPYLLLSLGFRVAIEAVLKDMFSDAILLSMEDPRSHEAQATNAAILKDTRTLLGVEVLFLLGSFVVAVFAFGITAYSSAMSYVGRSFTLSDLFYGLRRKWIRLVITAIYNAILSMGVVSLLGMLLVFSSVVAQGKSLIVLAVVVTILAAPFYLYLANIWMLALVMSVVEDDWYGLAAIGKVESLISGRKRQAMRLQLLLWLSVFVTSLTLFIIVFTMKPGDVMRLSLNAGIMCVLCLLQLFFDVVYTVFYYECKKSQGEPVELADAKGYTVLTSEV